jgi:siroheme synthase-like protein
MNVIPVFLPVPSDRAAIVIGGGATAVRKTNELIAAGAAVVVIAPDADAAIAVLAREGRIEWRRRRYERGDLAGAWIAISADASLAEAAAIWHDAREAGVPVNTHDDEARSTFVAGSTIRRGPLAVAVSTGGASPAFAQRLRRQIDAAIPDGTAWFLDRLAELRPLVNSEIPTVAGRRDFWREAVDSAALELRSRGYAQQAEQCLQALLASRFAAAVRAKWAQPARAHELQPA